MPLIGEPASARALDVQTTRLVTPARSVGGGTQLWEEEFSEKRCCNTVHSYHRLGVLGCVLADRDGVSASAGIVPQHI